MKKIIIILVAIFSICEIKAQSLDVVSKSYGDGYSVFVIQPTINNFIYLTSLSEIEFESEMKKYKYFEQEEQGKYRSFWNGSVDNYSYAFCVNTFCYNVMRNEIRFFVSKDMIYPLNSITSLYRDLRSYYRDSKEGCDYFAFYYEGYTYQFFISDRGKMYDIQVLKVIQKEE